MAETNGRLPDFITFTGLDAWTDLDRVEELSRRYPIEWGVLFSPKRQGVESRYPALGVVQTMLKRPLRRAAHLCGGYARTIVAVGRCPELQHLLAENFGRYQVNTDDPEVRPCDMDRFAGRMNYDSSAILQSRDPMAFPDSRFVEWLYDRSGGRGDLPKRWPVPNSAGPRVGYAGGLGPDTVVDAMAAIKANHPTGRPYWIDMESGVRTDDRLDLGKCEAVCRAVYGDLSARPLALTGEG